MNTNYFRMEGVNLKKILLLQLRFILIFLLLFTTSCNTHVVKYGMMNADSDKANDINAVPLPISGISVNARNDEGYNVLHLAVQRGDLEIVNALLQVEGIDVKVINRHGLTALHMAARIGHLDILNALLLKAPNIDVNIICLWWSSSPYSSKKGLFRNRKRFTASPKY